MSVQSVAIEVPEAPAAADFAMPPSASVRGGDILACGFAMTVTAWLTAYLSRMPVVNAPGEVTVSGMLAMVFVGGILAARYSRKGMWAALFAGAVSGMLNILIVGSVYHDMSKEKSAPSAALWIVGSVLLTAVVAGIGGVIGSRIPSMRRGAIRWPQVFAVVLCFATLPLITAGGLVTAFRAGLAVPDWPQSYGYNMFLFPLSKMQSAQGNFYEHAHRLMGSLVGFTNLALAIYLTIAERRRWVKLFAWGIGVGVAIQAVFGGLRVTEQSIPLAITHGIFAQLVFAAMCCLAAVAGNTFLTHRRVTRAAGSSDRLLTAVLLAMLILQLFLGALLRHTNALVMVHISLAALVALVALAVAFRAWGLYGDLLPIKRTGVAIAVLVLLQLTLGIIALVLRPAPHQDPTIEAAFLTTAHQANGAMLLALSAVLCLWTWRLVLLVPPSFSDAELSHLPTPPP